MLNGFRDIIFSGPPFVLAVFMSSKTIPTAAKISSTDYTCKLMRQGKWALTHADQKNNFYRFSLISEFKDGFKTAVAEMTSCI